MIDDMKKELRGLKNDVGEIKTILWKVAAFRWGVHADALLEHDRRLKRLESRP
jgi:hypothetical protein